MSTRMILGGAALAAAATMLVPAAAASASPSAHVQASPASVSKKLFSAWGRRDHVAAAKVATPSAVKTIFSYVFRSPDEFAGCTSAGVCRFVHTSVHVPGGLNGILVVVSGGKVTKVYESRLITKPGSAAQWLFKAWQKNDRHRAYEVAKKAAVTTLFRTKFDPHGVTYFWQGCTAEPKGYSCAYSYEGGAMLMHVRGSKVRGYDVRTISYIAD
ncbi:hypothetical protein J5X84_20390 [Streptosporangiaceae bacterium NEAU-GS5]|nr:hypothetical protein [Streptosporangiaceae bacterium NEAU-GS5]